MNASAPFVTQLRSRPGAVRLDTGSGPAITLRVQVPEVWDTVRVVAPADVSVEAVKQRALEALVPDAPHAEDHVTKFRGVEILDERISLADAGVRDGSILLVTYRRRRAVR